MIFVDGIGIGKEDYQYNPFFKYGFKTFENKFGQIPSLKNKTLKAENTFLFPVDARLGILGLPQSGTGQSSIFCGVNAPEIIGMHFGPYPYSSLVPIIKKKNIFRYFLDKKKKVMFANAYPKVFFEYIKSGKRRLSATTLMCGLNGMRLNSVTDVRKAKALTAEITNERWNEKLGYSLPVISTSTAAKRLLRIADRHYFTLFEYFLSDHIGHGRYADEFEKIFKTLDNFLESILANMDYKKTTLVICSDHGNLEDLSVKTHTLNPALMISAGKHASRIFRKVKSLNQIKGALVGVSRSN